MEEIRCFTWEKGDISYKTVSCHPDCRQMSDQTRSKHPRGFSKLLAVLNQPASGCLGCLWRAKLLLVFSNFGMKWVKGRSAVQLYTLIPRPPE